MWRTCVLAMCLFFGLPFDSEAFGETVRPKPVRSLAARQRWARFVIVRGRITAIAPFGQTGRLSSGSPEDACEELFTIHCHSGETAIRYERRDAEQQLQVEFQGTQRVTVLRVPTSDSQHCELHLQQDRDGLELVAREAGKLARFRSPSLWHLLLTVPQMRDDIITTLEYLRPNWRLGEQLAQLEPLLLDSVRQQPRPPIERLVQQLADPRFAVRQSADRQLRAYGHSLLPMLEKLDFSRLNAEQKHRLAEIQQELSPWCEDNVTQVAAWLVNDVRLWTAWQQSDDAFARSVADYHLAWLNDQPLPQINVARSTAPAE